MTPSTAQESALVDALLSDPTQWPAVAVVQPEHFEDLALGRIWAALHACAEAGRAPDAANALEYLQAHRTARDPDWEAELRRAWLGEALAVDMAARARAVLGHWRLRQIREVCRRAYEDAARTVADDAGALADRAVGELLSLDAVGSDLRVQTVREVSRLVRDDLQTRMAQAADARLPGLPTGWRIFDPVIGGGWAPGGLTVLKGRTGKGKTAWAMAAAVAAARAAARTAYTPHSKRVLVFSVEMPALALGQRLAAAASAESATALRLARLDGPALQRVLDGLGSLDALGSQLLIVDRPGLTLGEMRRTCAQVAREPAGLGLVVLDYLQLVQAEGATRELEVAAVAHAALAVARQCGAHVLCLAQMNEAGHTRESKVAEQHASTVALFDPAAGEDEDADVVKYDLVVEKNRNGPLLGRGRCQWTFKKSTQEIRPIVPGGWQ